MQVDWALCPCWTEWLAGAHATHIEHHSLLSDNRTIALVTPGGTITWFCAPRIDSPALFAHLLGGDGAGHFTVQPVSAERVKRQQARAGDVAGLDLNIGDQAEVVWPFLMTKIFAA